MQRTAPRRRATGRAVATLAAAGFLVAAAGTAASADDKPTADPTAFQVDDHCNHSSGIHVPEGFCATLLKKGLVGARHMVFTEDGRAYVAIADARDGSRTGGVVALRDKDGDGYADQMERFGTKGGNGIAYRDGMLWFAMNDSIVRYDVSDGKLKPKGAPTTIVSGLPADGDHAAKTVVLGDGDAMYVNLGSASNSCQVANRTLESPGVDPCPELPLRSGVWKFSAMTAGQTAADGERVATGTRNMNALAVQPGTGDLFGVQNGRDQLAENWPDLFTEADDLVLPAEELFKLDGDKDYGWPYCYYDAQKDQKVLAPEYGGDGTIVGRCATATDPLLTFPAHWAPLSMAFYDADQFPAAYRGGAFVAFHGSRFDPVNQPEGPGYEVAFVPFDQAGAPTGSWMTFADGFAGDAKNPPDDAAHRAVGLAIDQHGQLYVTDDKAGTIYRVTYMGDAAGRDPHRTSADRAGTWHGPAPEGFREQ